MIKKIILNYEPISKQITDDAGTYIGTWVDNAQEPKEAAASKRKPAIDVLLSLKEVGFTVEEILEMSKENLI